MLLVSRRVTTAPASKGAARAEQNQPRVNLIIRGPDGSWRRRYDMAYEYVRLILDYDGRQHAEDTRQWRTDISGARSWTRFTGDW
jgi:hypothetical protein